MDEQPFYKKDLLKSKRFTQVVGTILFVRASLLFFGHIPEGYYRSYERVQEYKTHLNSCGSQLQAEKYFPALDKKVCSCIYDYYLTKSSGVADKLQDRDMGAAAVVQRKFYTDVRNKFNLDQSSIFTCEALDMAQRLR